MSETLNPVPNDHDVVDNAPDVRVYAAFEDMPLHQNLLRGIYSHGLEKPSAIQQRAIVPLLNGGDIIAQAQFGTGKTSAFSIGTLQRLDWRHKTLQALVLSPTRELALQTYEVLKQLGVYMAESGFEFAQTFVGGTRVQDDIRRMQSGSMVGIGTPGRVLDLMNSGAFHTEQMKLLVLDEADEMLSQGFQEQIYEIFRHLPKDIQVALFSATMPSDVLALTQQFMRAPTRILVKQDQNGLLEGIKQFYVAVEDDSKLETLMDLYESVSIAQSVIFANTHRKVDFVSEQLNAHKHTVSSIHGEMAQGDREHALGQFRSGARRVLVTTDLGARVIDVHRANVVINFDLPPQADVGQYVRRISDRRRYGRKGVVISFVTQSDFSTMREIESRYHTTILELPMNFAQHLSD